MSDCIKRVIKISYMILLIALSIFFTYMYIIEKATDKEILIQIIKMDLYDFFFLLLCLIMGGVLFLIIRFCGKNKRKLYKMLSFFCMLIIVVVMICGGLIWFLHRATTNWHEFYSPDNKHSLVVREVTFLLLGDVYLYERISPIFVRETEASILIDDGLASISQGAYKIFWDEAVVTISVDINQSGMWSAFKLNMAEHGKVLKQFVEYPYVEPRWMYDQDYTEQKDMLILQDNNSETEYIREEKLNQEIIDGLRATALATGYKIEQELEITYTSKGTPKLELSKDMNSSLYILYDRESLNGKCALYVLYKSQNSDEGYSDIKILEMYAYEYSKGKVIMANRHAWSDVGTDEYRKVTGE